MRRIARAKLDAATAAALGALAAKVKAAPNRKTKPNRQSEARELWDQQSGTSAFRAIRKALETMASGRARCMYCEDSFGTDIEHFYPKARYPLKAFAWPNYLLACSHCNSNRKRSRFPIQARRPALLDPTADDPAQHLVFLPSTGGFQSCGAKGPASIDVFGLNDATAPRKLPQARKSTFLKLQLLLEEYDRLVASGDVAAAGLVRQAVSDEPFTAVLGWLIDLASGPAANAVLRPNVPAIIRRHGVATWV